MAKTAYIILVLTTLMWSGNSIAGKMAVGHVSPMILVFFRWLLAFLVFLPIGWKPLRRDWPVVRRHLLKLGLMGASGFTLFNAIFYTALNYTTAINVSIEQAGVPVTIIVVNFLLFRLRVTWAQILGVLLTIFGVILAASHGDPLQLMKLQLNFGDAIMLIAVVLYSVYSVGLRLKPALGWQSLMLVFTGSSLVAAIPFAIWEIGWSKPIFPDTEGWLLIAYTAFIVSAISQVLFIRGIELIGPNRAGIFINLVPIFGTLLSVAILGESLNLYQGVALAFVLGGIWLAETSGRKRPF
ncbi:MAG: DMT family transporter [Rhizobiaceae bacterium]|nr:MAG: DMT family transporter [Rhizobiaceae bacterium]